MIKFDFRDQTVLVTGSSRGIGRCIATRFAESGARIILHYNKGSEKAEELLRSLPGEGHLVFGADLEDPSAIEKMARAAVQQAGRIDLLINNAGIYEECALPDASFSDWLRIWDRTIAINLSATAHMSYFMGRHMKENGGGKIICISSRGAFRGEPQAPAYAASKSGMNAMLQSLAKSLAPHHVYVYGVAPGFVETEMAKTALSGPQGDSIRRQSPMGRVATVEDVAHAVLMLASAGNEFMTGTIVDVNGASYLRM